MAPADVQDNTTEEIVYDSQEEADAWPESQLSNGDGNEPLIRNHQRIPEVHHDREPRSVWSNLWTY
jgi:hypothetical protein